MEWFVHGWKSEHPVHDTFFIGRLRATGRYSASRVFIDASGERGYGCDVLGEHATFEAAQLACEARIRELDAVAASAPLEASL
jgi:hypothetical protein